MRNDVSQYAEADINRTASVMLHQAATFAELISGTAAGGVDVSAYVESCTQTESDANIRFRWNDTFLDTPPAPGNLISISADGRVLFNGIVDTVNDFREERGQRTLAVTVRARDGVNLWRTNRYNSKLYGIGTNLNTLAIDVLTTLGLLPHEYILPPTGITLPHNDTQMADMTAWQILTHVGFASGQAPFTDALGRLRMINKSFIRDADVVIPQDRVLAISGSKAKSPVSRLVVRWMDPELRRVTQDDQVLETLTMTAGFFKMKHSREAWFSDDRRQRSQNTYMRVVQSVNDSLLPVGDETYEQLDIYHGEVTVATRAWVPGLATLSVATLLTLDAEPDGVQVGTSGTGYTIPWGRVARGAAEVSLLLTMMSLGTGVYEIWGQPYDFVHLRNASEAFDVNAPAWLNNVEEVENDLIGTEAQAQFIAINELLFRNAQAFSWGLTIVDDPRIEKGDILALEDGSRIYVEGYSRDLTRGSKAVMEINGFRV